MTHIEFKNFFEDLAKKHKRIQHSEENKRFCMWFEIDTINSWSGVADVFLVLNEGTGFFKKMDLEYQDSRRCGFEVHVAMGDDTANLENMTKAISDAESIGKDIIAYMIAISQDFSSGVCPRFMQQFKADTVMYESFESKLPGFMTCLFSFEISDEEFLIHNPDQWL